MTIVAKFEIPYTCYLEADGSLKKDAPKFAQDPELLLQLYRLMTIIRTFDTKAITLQRTGKLGTYPSNLGHEALSVAIGHTMKPEDVYCCAYREYGAMMQRGVKLSEVLLYWGGDERGNQFANNAQDTPICVPIATQCLHAAGIAKAIQLRREPRVVVCTVGDGGTSQGDFYEALNVAGVWQLPVVFVINNNRWAISVPLSKQTACQTLAQKAVAAGLHCEQVDGNDVIAVKHVIANAIERARSDKGASVIEALTYRLGDHTTADDAKRYRSQDELDCGWANEPIVRLRKYLESKKLWHDDNEQSLQQEANQLIDEVVKEYIAVPPPEPVSMFEHLYAKLPDGLAEQYLTVLEYGEYGEHGHG